MIKEDWVVSPQFSKRWKLAQRFTIGVIGTVCKLFAVVLNKTQVHNPKPVLDAAYNRPKGIPLITISNHMSCCDDPITYGALLPLSKFFTDIDKFRWLLGAREVCFTKKSHSIFFRLGKVVPIVRGDGVYQTTMNEILNELNKGDWLHIFSEGKINLNNEILGLRWGLGRLVADSNVTPIVIVLFHQGLEKILPNDPPFIPQINKKATLVCGEPIILDDFVRELKASKKTPMEIRKIITDKIEVEFHKLRTISEELHAKHIGK